MGGLIAEVGEPITRVFNDEEGTAGLPETGYGLKIDNTTEEVTKCAAGSSLYAIAYVDTKNPLYLGDTALYSQYLKDPEIACIREGEANVQLEPNATRTTDIHVGDIIAVATTAGHFFHWEDNAAQGTAAGQAGSLTLAAWMAARSEICGVSEETIANGDDTDDELLHVRLTIFGDET